MKKVMRNFFKFLFYITYPILAIALVISLTVLIITIRERDALNNTFAQATQELNSENQSKEITIEDLKSEFSKMTTEVANLRAENADLKDSIQKMQLEGYGSISGKIFPVVSAGNKSFSQYQRVCAQAVNNENLLTCQTVSALQQTYSMNVPAGKYKVYAELYPQDATSAFAGVKTYYTAYIKCVQASTQNGQECNQDKLKAPVELEIKVGTSVSNVDPIDWR